MSQSTQKYQIGMATTFQSHQNFDKTFLKPEVKNDLRWRHGHRISDVHAKFSSSTDVYIDDLTNKLHCNFL